MALFRSTIGIFFVAAALVLTLSTVSVLANPAECEKSLEDLVKFKHPDALRVIGATGKWINDYGSMDNCLASQNARYLIVSAAINMTTPMAVSIGLCVPSNCTAEDINYEYAKKILPFIDGRVPIINGTFAATEPGWAKWTSGAIAVLVVTIVLVALVTLATLAEWYFLYLKPWFQNVRGDSWVWSSPVYFLDGSGDDEDSTGGYSINEQQNQPLLPQYEAQGNKKAQQKYVEPNKSPASCCFMYQLLNAFSLFQNVPKLFVPERSLGLEIFNGIRVITMGWIVLGHMLTSLVISADNLVDMPVVMSRLSFQFIWNAMFSVDTFFFMSGVLVSTLTLKALHAQTHMTNWFLYYLHRYVRLTPVLAFWLFFYWKLLPMLGRSPFYGDVAVATAKGCDGYWWANLLYLNNYFPTDANQCMGWSWYLAVDTQLFIVAPVFLVVFHWRRSYGWILLALGLVASHLYVLIMTIKHHFSPFLVDEVSLDNFYLLYTKAYARAGPFLVGFILSYINFQYGKRLVFSRTVRFVGLALSLGVMFFLVYGPWENYRNMTFTGMDVKWNRFEQVLFVVFSRSAWALALAFITLMCSKGYFSLIRDFLGASFWGPLARLSYSVYIVHLVWITYMFAIRQGPTHYNEVNTALYFILSLTVSVVGAFLTYLAIERPVMTLERLILTRIMGKSD